MTTTTAVDDAHRTCSRLRRSIFLGFVGALWSINNQAEALVASPLVPYCERYNGRATLFYGRRFEFKPIQHCAGKALYSESSWHQRGWRRRARLSLTAATSGISPGVTPKNIPSGQSRNNDRSGHFAPVGGGNTTPQTNYTRVDYESVNLRQPLGKWEYMYGNYIIRPSSISSSNLGKTPRALLHFLGGALIGAAPQIAYRYILEKLAERNYLVVTTPFILSFNHLQTCDEVIGKFERVAPRLARQYGAIPVIGVGHSLGSVLQLLITSLFPDTPRAGNVLLSYNNKDVREAVPLFDEVVTPIFNALADEDGLLGGLMNLGGASAGSDAFNSDRLSERNFSRTENRSSVEGLNLMLKFARTATQGELPPDDLLESAAAYAALPISAVLGSSSISGLLPPPSIPKPLRAALEKAVSPQVSTLRNYGMLPFLDQVLDVADQIPLLITEVADGARDFTPTPVSVGTAAKRAYRARRTLLIQFDNDSLDETDVLEGYLRESEQIMRMKRPMVGIEVQKSVLVGNHVSPILAPPLEAAERAENILGKDGATDVLLYKDAEKAVEVIARWLDNAPL